ncbi:hypothetical protein K9M48_01265 [Candidatus Gracilibacteria bacterium]|nr:hypothetical protein [Candidatus Gracilibacteria bacterium]
MEGIKNLQETLLANKYLLFYKIMKYPIPKNMEYFFFGKKIDQLIKPDNKSDFSRNKKNKYMDEYIQFINKYGKLYRSLPFVKEIYLCNSISFNSLNKDSDIDLFIITKKNSIRRARLFSVLFFRILGIKRYGSKFKKKFCLSFYITQDNKNLYNIMLSRSDVYLNYWLAHLITLYQEDNNTTNIYTKNPRFKVTMPNHPNKQCINIGNKVFYGNTKSKKIIENLLGGLIGTLVENTIKLLWIPVLKRKLRALGKNSKGIIISNNMLKFYKDQREKIHLMYEIQSKSKR